MAERLDGIELDWMRSPLQFRKGHERKAGYDADVWLREGLVDLIRSGETDESAAAARGFPHALRLNPFTGHPPEREKMASSKPPEREELAFLKPPERENRLRFRCRGGVYPQAASFRKLGRQ